MSKVIVKDLKKSFGSNEVLKSINLTVEEGEVVCIIGPSGSGKSTLLRCLNRLEEINGGQVVINGTDISTKDVDLKKARENIGMVFQLADDNLITLTHECLSKALRYKIDTFCGTTGEDDFTC